MKCPCCGGPMPEDPLLRLEATYLTGSERRLAVFYAERFGRWQFNEMVADAGGPDDRGQDEHGLSPDDVDKVGGRE